jgi:hypothetical protein
MILEARQEILKKRNIRNHKILARDSIRKVGISLFFLISYFDL